jgi:(1->4)-alpha-D-glucan 1-alpha-D-glucosylmutase
LAFWRVAAEEINYRRFFDVNDLACNSRRAAQRSLTHSPDCSELVSERAVTGTSASIIRMAFICPRDYFEKLSSVARKHSGLLCRKDGSRHLHDC